MSVKFRIITTITVFIALLAATPTLAGTARSLALGSDPSYFKDSTNVLRWYSSIVDHPDQISLEFGDLVNDLDFELTRQDLIGHGGSVHARLDQDGHWGTVGFYFQDNLEYGPTDGSFSALWGRNLGPVQIGLGGHFTTYAKSLVGTEIGDRADAQYLHQYGLGAQSNITNNILVEFSGEVTNRIGNNINALYNSGQDDNWNTYGFRLRSFISVSPLLTLVPLVDHYKNQGDTFDQDANEPLNRDAHLTRLGLGANLQTENNILLLVSTEYRNGQEILNWLGHSIWDTSKREYYQIRCRVGAEAKPESWLTIRAGIQYIRVHEDQYRYDHAEVPSEEQHRFEMVTTPITLGVGLHYKNFTADITLNDSAPLHRDLATWQMVSEETKGYSAITLGCSF